MPSVATSPTALLVLVDAISCSCKARQYLGLYSLNGKASYRKISWSLEAARFGFKLFQSLWNLAGTSAALLPRWLPNFSAIRPLQHPISRLRDFTRFGGKTSYRLVNRGPALHHTASAGTMMQYNWIVSHTLRKRGHRVWSIGRSIAGWGKR